MGAAQACPCKSKEQSEDVQWRIGPAPENEVQVPGINSEPLAIQRSYERIPRSEPIVIARIPCPCATKGTTDEVLMGPEAQLPESEVEVPEKLSEKLSVGENLASSISQQTGEEQINLGGAVIKEEAPAPSITKEDTLSVPEGEAKVQEAKPKPKPKHRAKHKGKAKPKAKKTLIDEVPIIDGHLPAGLPTAEQLILMINRDFEAIFKLGDKDGDGTLCHSEIEVLLIELLEHRELPLGTKTVAGFMYKVDRDRKGLVCKEEFNSWFSQRMLGGPVNSDERYGFRRKEGMAWRID